MRFLGLTRSLKTYFVMQNLLECKSMMVDEVTLYCFLINNNDISIEKRNTMT